MTWIRDQHAGQHIKRTHRPYFQHLISVGRMAARYEKLGFEIGLCHDLLEDTSAGIELFRQELIQIGYGEADAEKIKQAVVALTDVFTKKDYPNLTKKARKKLEARRLLTIGPEAQTVKYADLIYNINWVVEYDEAHARKYLQKKQQLIESMTEGNPELRAKALELVIKNRNQLNVEDS